MRCRSIGSGFPIPTLDPGLLAIGLPPFTKPILLVLSLCSGTLHFLLLLFPFTRPVPPLRSRLVAAARAAAAEEGSWTDVVSTARPAAFMAASTSACKKELQHQSS